MALVKFQIFANIWLSLTFFQYKKMFLDRKMFAKIGDLTNIIFWKITTFNK